MTKRNRLPRAAATLVLASAGAIVTMAGTASAAPPGDCHRSWSSNSGQAICYSADTYRVFIECNHAGTPYTVYGPWTSTGGTSIARCNSGDLLQNTQQATVYVEIG